jgi:hypothetical protein
MQDVSDLGWLPDAQKHHHDVHAHFVAQRGIAPLPAFNWFDQFHVDQFCMPHVVPMSGPWTTVEVLRRISKSSAIIFCRSSLIFPPMRRRRSDGRRLQRVRPFYQWFFVWAVATVAAIFELGQLEPWFNSECAHRAKNFDAV